MTNFDNTLIQAARAWNSNRLYVNTVRMSKGRVRVEYRHSRHDWGNPIKGRVAKGLGKAIRERFGDDFDAFYQFAKVAAYRESGRRG